MSTEALVETVKALQVQVETLTAEWEIRKLHHKYGYYIDKCLYKEVVDLFADHPETYVQFLGGKFKGKAGAKRLYIDSFQDRFVGGRNGPAEGFLLDHLQAQDIIDYDPKTGLGKARIRTLMSAGAHESHPEDPRMPKTQWWEGGLYENEYIKEGGVWKILKLRYFPFWHGTVEHGWRYTKPNYVPFFSKTYPENQYGPDEIVDAMLWPDTRVVPFHYPHPVTGKMVSDSDLQAPKKGESPEKAAPPLVLDSTVL